MSSVRAERLSFSYTGQVPILSGVDVHLGPGVTGVVGDNGAGKTTFLRLVAGELAPTAGRIRLDPRDALVIRCPQDVEAPTADVLWLAASEDLIPGRLMSVLGLDPPQVERWPTLSPGERRRWQIGAALAREPDVLLLDEPTNHVDGGTREVIVKALARHRGIAVIVSHDRELLEAVASRTLRLRAGAAQVHEGSYGAARAAWQAEVRAAWAARDAAQDAEREAARRLADARRELAAADASRRTSRRSRGRHDHDARSLVAKTVAAWAEDRLGRKVEVLRRELDRAGRAVPDSTPEKELGRTIFLGFERAPRPVLLRIDADRLDVAPGVPLLRDLHLSVRREDRIHVAGPNGAGKTTLVAAMVRAGRLPPDRVLYLPQELEPGAGAAMLAKVRALPPAHRGRVLSLVAGLGVDPDRLLATSAPSPGESRKLLLALGLGRHAWLLVLDEPTNHLDLDSVERVERALAEYPGAILLVTHDGVFAQRCTSATWRIEGGRVVT